MASTSPSPGGQPDVATEKVRQPSEVFLKNLAIIKRLHNIEGKYDLQEAVLEYVPRAMAEGKTRSRYNVGGDYLLVWRFSITSSEALDTRTRWHKTAYVHATSGTVFPPAP